MGSAPGADSRRTALVTGASGFLGVQVVRRLVVEGWRVHAIVRPTTDTARLEHFVDDVGIHVCDGTLSSLETIVRDADPHVTFHLASNYLTHHTSEDIEGLLESNVLFATRLLEALRGHGQHRFVNTGTSWQHFEGASYNPVNLYAATKQALEDILQFYTTGALNAATLKLCDTMGPGDWRPKLLNHLKRACLSGEALSMSPGEQMIDIVHVDDAARAVIMAGERLVDMSCPDHEAFGVSGELLSLRDVVRRAEGAWGRTVPVEWGEQPYRHREVMAPWRGEPLPGWAPQISFETALREIWEG